MFDFLFRRGNPTNQWHQPPGFMLQIDLARATINDVPLGSNLQSYSFLGRSSAANYEALQYHKMGLELEYEDDGTVSGFELVFNDFFKKYRDYSGQIQVNGSTVEVQNVIAQLGEPFWIDRDEEDTYTFFEYPGHEIEFEHEDEDGLQRIYVTMHPVMADPERRESSKVTKPWPPY